MKSHTWVSPFARFPLLTAGQTAMVDYTSDQDKSELCALSLFMYLSSVCSFPYTLVLCHPFPGMRGSKILVDMYSWVLTYYDLLSLAADSA